MHFLKSALIGPLGFFSLTALSSPLLASLDPSDFDPSDIIRRDVAVIGGGSSGTYSAISLLDKGVSVIVIEKQGRLGGHTATYKDPATGTTTELGVQLYHNYTIVHDYFGRFDIPLIDSPGFYPSVDNFDFRDGSRVTLPSPSQAGVSAALEAYAEQLEKYPGLEHGTYIPDPVPEDLYIPFGEFVEKYGLQAALPTLHNYNPGVGNILENPTLEVLRYWNNVGMLRSITTGFLITARHDSSELYRKAEAELRSTGSVLLNSTVHTAARQEDKAGVSLVINTPKGQKLVLAKRLLVAIPPKLDLVSPLDLSEAETALFSKFINAGYYVGVLANTSFSDETSSTNAIQTSPYRLPALPAAYNFSPTRIPGLQAVHYGTPQSNATFPLSDATIQAHVLREIRALQVRNPDVWPSITSAKWVDFHSHAPFGLQVRGEDIRDGFYARLYELQGDRNTFWTGAAWRAEDSTLVWMFSEEVVLPALMEGL